MIGGVGGKIGPDLDTVFERRDEAWIRVQIENPRSHNPISMMPIFGFSGDQIDKIIEILRDSR